MESLQDICDQIKELADKASMLAGALEEKDKSVERYAQKCHVLAARLSKIRDILVEEYGEEAKNVRTTSLIKRLIEEKNSCQKELSVIAEKVTSANEANGENRDENIAYILSNILNQSTDSQLSDLVRLRTVHGQGELIKRQRQQIESLREENNGLRGQVFAMQAQVTEREVKAKKMADRTESESAQYQDQIRELTEQNARLQSEVEFITLRETLSKEAHGYEVQDLNKRIQELEEQLKNSGKFKLSLALKKFALKIKSIFKGKNAEIDDSERV